jgi:hypothetical protein
MKRNPLISRDRLGNSNQHSFAEDFEFASVLSISYSCLIYKINIQYHISLSNSHSHSTANSLINITISYLNHLVRCIGSNLWWGLYVNLVSFSVSFSLSFWCFTVLVLSHLAVPAYRWMLQHPTLSPPAGVRVFVSQCPVQPWLVFPFPLMRIRVFFRFRWHSDWDVCEWCFLVIFIVVCFWVCLAIKGC